MTVTTMKLTGEGGLYALEQAGIDARLTAMDVDLLDEGTWNRRCQKDGKLIMEIANDYGHLFVANIDYPVRGAGAVLRSPAGGAPMLRRRSSARSCRVGTWVTVHENAVASRGSPSSSQAQS